MTRTPIPFLDLYWHSRCSLNCGCDVSTWENSEVRGIHKKNYSHLDVKSPLSWQRFDQNTVNRNRTVEVINFGLKNITCIDVREIALQFLHQILVQLLLKYHISWFNKKSHLIDCLSPLNTFTPPEMLSFGTPAPDHCLWYGLGAEKSPSAPCHGCVGLEG